MAVAPTPEQAGRHIIKMMVDRGTRAGEVMRLSVFMMEFAAAPWGTGDLNAELQYAGDQGWIEKASSDAFIKLTQAGFDAA